MSTEVNKKANSKIKKWQDSIQFKMLEVRIPGWVVIVLAYVLMH